jgi:hypothetical protein
MSHEWGLRVAPFPAILLIGKGAGTKLADIFVVVYG